MKKITEETRKKISESIKRAHAEGRLNTTFGGNQGWAKGKSKLTDSRLMNRSKLTTPICDILKIYSAVSCGIIVFIKEYIEFNSINLFCCGHETWNGEKLAYHLHHKNGNKKDNRKENLEFLCPNCHSLTENYGFKGRKHKAL